MRWLMAAVLAVWGAVWLFTQLLPADPLGTGPTVAIGLAASLLSIAAYPTMTGAPRRLSGLSASSIESPLRDPLALVGRAMSRMSDGVPDDALSQSASLLLPVIGGRTVEITNTERVLGSAHAESSTSKATDTLKLRSKSASSPPHSGVLSDASLAVIEQGTASWNETSDGLVVATPLRADDVTIGTLTVTFEKGSTPSVERLEAVAGLLSLYMQIGDLTQQAQLAADARLDALRAQINPHFLFNTLNTIASKSRTDPDEARQLLQRLADFFRYATQQEGQYAEFAHEYFFVRTYLSLEQARFSERLEVHYDIDPQVLTAQVPVLVIQPLVENAVKHGIAPQPKGGTVTLRARVNTLAGSIRISVRDNGVGMARELLTDVTAGTYRSTSGGVGVRNIHERLDQLYGSRYQFDIRSSPGKGTRIELELPL